MDSQDLIHLLCRILFQNQSPVSSVSLPSVMRWEADGAVFMLRGVSGPSNGRDPQETPSGLGAAWLGGQSWHFPR